MGQEYDKKTWLEYVTKLNDREVRRQSSNGLTVWALIGVIGVLSFKIIDEFNVVFGNSKSLFITAIFLTILLNICNVLNLIITNIKTRNRKRGIIPDINWECFTVYHYTIYLIVILLMVLNYNVAIFSYQEQLSGWPFMVFSILYFLNLLSQIYLTFKNRKAKLRVEPDFGSRVNRFSSLSNWLPFLVMTIISIREILILNLILINQVLLKVALEVTAIIFCFGLLSFKYGTSLKNSWLEVFEKEILINDLSAEQIRIKFIEEFTGKQALNWLSRVKNEIEKRNIILQTRMQELEDNSLDFNDGSLDFNDTIGLLNLKSEFINKVVDELEDYNNYLKLRTEDIKNFYSQGLINKEEKGYIELVENQSGIINSSYKEHLAKQHKINDQILHLDKTSQSECKISV